MSRTEKDKPYWVLVREGSWRTKIGYPPAITGVNTGASDDVKLYWKRERTRERETLAYLEEPKPSRHRRSAVWHNW